MIFQGIFRIWEAFEQHQLNTKAFGFYVIFISILMPLLVLLLLYFIVNRKHKNTWSVCLGIAGTAFGLVHYFRAGGLGVLFAFGYEYNSLLDGIGYFTSRYQSDTTAVGLLTVLCYMLLVFAALAAVALGMCIYHLKKRRLFGLRLILMLSIPLAGIVLFAIIANQILPGQPFGAIGWYEAILPLLLALAWGRQGEKTPDTTSPSKKSENKE